MEAEWFKDRLVELRMEAGLSRKDLAAKAGLQSEAGIRDLEQGRRRPGWETVVALCKALGVSCDAFLQEPTGQHKTRAGRPRKTDGAAGEAAPKRQPEDMPPAQSKPRGRKTRTTRGS
jgi:transcriptional regulator with XRE-family HTH domain